MYEDFVGENFLRVEVGFNFRSKLLHPDEVIGEGVRFPEKYTA